MHDHAFIGRQPILDANQQIIAYELLFRDSASAINAVIEDNLKACARVLVNTMSDMGAQWLLGDKLAFINVSEELLRSEFLELLPPQRTVLEVLEDVPANTAVLQRLYKLRGQGFQIALDDFIPTDKTIPLLNFADYVKLDVHEHGLEATSELAVRFKDLPIKLIAEKVETQEEFEACQKMGFHFFQGYYFAHPETLSARVITPSYAAVLDLLNMVSKGANIEDVENGFKRDPVLSLKLLRYINSVGCGLACEIQSIRHALTLLGPMQLYRWLTLLMVTAGESTAHQALMKTAITRGRLTELLGIDFFDQNDRDNLFIVGVFSLLDAMLAMPMEQVLEKMLLPEAITDALLNRSGIYGPFLQLAEACEDADCSRIATLAAWLEYDPDRINDCHIAALAWVENLGV